MSNSLSQLRSFTKVLYLQKRRNPIVCCCETFSHLFLFILLLMGYGLSKVLYLRSKTFDTIMLYIPPFEIDTIPMNSYNNGTTNNINNNNNSSSSISSIIDFRDVLLTVDSILQNPIMTPTFDQYMRAQKFISNIFSKNNENEIDFIFSSQFGERYGNLIEIGAIHFAPYPNDQVDNLVSYLNTTTTMFQTLNIYYHSNEDEAVHYILDNLNERAFALIVLREITVNKINYVLRMNYTALPNTNQIIIDSPSIDNTFQEYVKSGFMTMQQTIDDWIFNYISNNINPTTTLSQQEYCQSSPSSNTFYEPYPVYEYYQNPFFGQVGFLLGVAMVMSTLYPMSRLVKSIVEEKEMRMRELMLIMGLKTWVHDLAWWLMSLILFFWIAISVTYVSKVSFLPNSNGLLLFIYFFFFMIALMQFSFLVAVFFNNSKLAAIVAPVVLFCSILPRYIFFDSNNNENVKPKLLASILLPTSFTFGADIIADYENKGLGIQFSNINSTGYSFLTCLGMMLFDLVFYAILTWYFDKVLPKEFGSKLHPLFFLNPFYWFPNTCLWIRLNNNSWNQLKEGIINIDINDDYKIENSFESIPVELQSSIKIEIDSLTKVYPNGKVAVKNLTLYLIENQITCLLGSNGAGKSSTMAMLTGLTSPTSGSSSIYGYSLLNEMFKIRTITGICFQQDVLFPMLTVREHVTFFGIVKGITLRKIKQEVENLVIEVGLNEKIDTTAGQLSGGQKRKLCLACALIGNPKFLIIDECTSGMDPSARRNTWDVLIKRKKDSVILLSTHYMWEADFLGDRIAIMSDGELIAMGSSLFLKSSLGDGYLLTLSKESESSCDVDKVNELITNILPKSVLSQIIAGEITFRLDMKETDKFPLMLATLQSQAKKLGIGSFGIALTSLEQVFVKLASKSEKVDDDDDNNNDNDNKKVVIHEETKKDNNDERSEIEIINYEDWMNYESSHNIINDDDDDDDNASDKDSITKLDNINVKLIDSSLNDDDFEIGMVKLIRIQLFQLIYKRFRIASRDMKGFFFQIIFPAIQILLVLAILTIQLNPAGHTIPMNASMFIKSGNGRKNLEISQYRGNEISFAYDSISNKNINIINKTMGISSPMLSDLLIGNDVTGKVRQRPESMGSIIFKDTVPLNITVDWYWVKTNLPALLSYQEELKSITNIDFATSFNNFKLSSDQVPFDNLLANDLLTAITLQVINSTLISTTTPDTIIESSTIQYDPTSSSILLTDATVTYNNFTIDLGNISVNVIDIIPYLPNDTKEYTININTNFTIMHNTSSPHASCAFNGELLNAAFSECFNNPDAIYLPKNHPLPVTKRQALEIKLILSFLASIFVLVPLCYIPASFVSFIVRERSTKSKHLQLISGVSSNVYWIATYIWDMMLFSILALFILCAFAIYGSQSAVVFISDPIATLSLFLLLLTYGLSVIPLSYLYSLSFENHSTAQISIMAINFFTGFVAVLAYFIMSNIPETMDAAKKLVHLFRFFPPYCIGEGLIAISTTYYQNALFDGTNISYLSYEVTGRPIIIMVIEAIGYFSALLLTEHWTIVWLKQRIDKFRVSDSLFCHKDNEDDDTIDEDVDKERIKISESSSSSSSSSYALLIKGLVKLYPPSLLGGKKKRAVKNLNLAVPYGEIFGLLGSNGAGKSTTLSIVTMDNFPTEGSVDICGLPLSNSKSKLLIGYCPQTDPIMELLNSYETLFFYGRIRGIKESVLTKRVNELILQVGLSKHASRLCGTYSGGNKRKLSLAVALIGDPKLLVLDEPSSGMDPYARRQMWTTISAVSKKRCVILTTHSMEECEALCGRLTIMSMGRMQCIGSVQHLKSRFGSGYSIEIRIGKEKSSSSSSAAAAASSSSSSSSSSYLSIEEKIKIIQDALPLALDESREDYIRLTGDRDLSLELAFQFIEENKKALAIDDYSISQFPLEQIFNKLAHTDSQ